MTRIDDLAERIDATVDALGDELHALMAGAIDTQSPPGHEREVSEYLAGWLNDRGIPARTQIIEPTRANVVGRIKGAPGGPSVALNAHMDTTFVGDESDLGILGHETRVTPRTLQVADGQFVGLGVYNDKGPFVAACIGALALREAGVGLGGDIVLAGVAGEIGRGQTGEHTGPGTRGKGIGTYQLLHHGVWTDYAIVCEGSGWSISWALPGAAYFRVTTRGEATYAPMNDRAGRTGAESQNAIVQASQLVLALEEWAEGYESRSELDTPCGRMRPRVTVGAIDGGLPFKPNWRPAVANIYLDVRVPPTRTPLEVKRELEAFVAAAAPGAEVDMYLARRGFVGEGVEPIAASLESAHRDVFGAAPPPPSWRDLSMWNDSNIYAEAGIPAVKYGPAAPTSRNPGRAAIEDIHPERLDIDAAHRAAKVYALAAARLVGVR